MLMPFISRGGLGMMITAYGLLWLVGAGLCSFRQRLGALNGWLLIYLALLSGHRFLTHLRLLQLAELLSYLGVMPDATLLEQALMVEPLVNGLLKPGWPQRGGTGAICAPTEDLALWADPNSVADGTRRIYSTWESQPSGRLSGALMPLAVVFIAFRGFWPRLRH